MIKNPYILHTSIIRILINIILVVLVIDGHIIKTNITEDTTITPALNAQGFDCIANQRVNLINIILDDEWESDELEIIDDAECLWEMVIRGRRVSFDDSVDIYILKSQIDGTGNTLGHASTTQRRTFSLNGRDVTYNTRGVIYLDEMDIRNFVNNRLFFNLVAHEIGHILGVGSAWEVNDLLHGFSYTGAMGVYFFKKEYAINTTYIQIESNGGDGTAGHHWTSIGDSYSPTVTYDIYGRPISNVLMSGWLNGPGHLASFTIGSMSDIGYSITNICGDDTDCDNGICIPGFITTCGEHGTTWTTPTTWDTQSADKSYNIRVTPILVSFFIGLIILLVGMVFYKRRKVSQVTPDTPAFAI